MIHHTCPCCEVALPPHRDGCTFAADCPEACEDFDYVASLRLTDDEREAFKVAAEWCRAYGGAVCSAGVIDRFLERTK